MWCQIGRLWQIVNQISRYDPNFRSIWFRSCCFLRPVHGTGDPIAAGISPEKLFAVRSRYRRCESRSISAGIGTTKEFCNKRRYSSLKQLRISGNSPGMSLLERSSTMRFLRSQIVAGIFSLMALLWSEIAVTVLSVHLISGQSQGEDEEFHDWSDGGLPSCCLTSSRIDRSSSWEITWKGKERTRRRNRAGSGILANKKVSFGIFVALSS